ncbi:hypothetical protein C2845_PM07G10580 [Panicum miliaceum]|uniref:Secreted protein n=1 Tax=Panicum miliaceum TaxID=4540 RepID=A0A3L6SLI9_PANMI|nr:hypothetical protein C2845_PM07G10580 [Panicum miliaceum]
MQPRFGHLCILLFLLLAASPCSPQEQKHEVVGALRESFLRCVVSVSPATADPSRIVHAPSEPSYPSPMNATIQNLRFASPRTPRPALLLAPATVAEVRACVACCRRHGLTHSNDMERKKSESNSLEQTRHGGSSTSFSPHGEVG